MTIAVPLTHYLGLQPYTETLQAMREFTDQRNPDTRDEIWVVEHPAVFTLGQRTKPEHLLNPGDIPIIQTDRGGQVTYHGPGQLVVYILFDLQRRQLNVRRIVTLLEESVIQLLATYRITAQARCDAPGVYVDTAKIASVGLRIRKGCSYHGLALNVAMDLEPFSRINPCGYRNLVMTQLSALGGPSDLTEVASLFIKTLLHLLSNSSAPSALDKIF